MRLIWFLWSKLVRLLWLLWSRLLRLLCYYDQDYQDYYDYYYYYITRTTSPRFIFDCSRKSISLCFEASIDIPVQQILISDLLCLPGGGGGGGGGGGVVVKALWGVGVGWYNETHLTKAVRRPSTLHHIKRIRHGIGYAVVSGYCDIM